MSKYVVLYDISWQESIPIEPLSYTAGFFFLIVFLSIIIRVVKKNSAIFRKVSFYAGGISIGCIFIVSILNSMREKTNSFIEISKNGSMQVVEGEVENYHPMPVGGHDSESFYVAGVYFAYSDFEITGGFNNAASHGGPIHRNMRVRIGYTKWNNRNVILKIEKIGT